MSSDYLRAENFLQEHRSLFRTLKSLQHEPTAKLGLSQLVIIAINNLDAKEQKNLFNSRMQMQNVISVDENLTSYRRGLSVLDLTDREPNCDHDDFISPRACTHTNRADKYRMISFRISGVRVLSDDKSNQVCDKALLVSSGWH